jgi:hypothetical protein
VCSCTCLPTSIGDKPSGINLLHGHRSSDERSNHIVATERPCVVTLYG